MTIQNSWTDHPAKSNATLGCAMAAMMFTLLLKVQAGTVTNPPPVAVNDVVQRHSDSGLRLRAAKLLANDTDISGEALKLISVSATSAAGGTVRLQGEWISFKPAVGFTNADSFTYVLANRSGLTATGLVTVALRADTTASQNVESREMLPNGDTRIQFVGIPGCSYRIQYSDNAETPRWQPLGKRVADATGQFALIDAASPAVAGRIYRSTYP